VFTLLQHQEALVNPVIFLVQFFSPATRSCLILDCKVASKRAMIAGPASCRTHPLHVAFEALSQPSRYHEVETYPEILFVELRLRLSYRVADVARIGSALEAVAQCLH
jgi:hypothetical protein